MVLSNQMAGVAPSVDQIKKYAQGIKEVVTADRFRKGYENALKGGFRGDSFSFAQSLVNEGYEVEGWEGFMRKRAEEKYKASVAAEVKLKQQKMLENKSEEEKQDFFGKPYQWLKNLVGATAESSAGLAELGIRGVSNAAEQVAMRAGNDDLAQRFDAAEAKTIADMGDVGQNTDSGLYKGTKLVSDVAQVVTPGGQGGLLDDAFRIVGDNIDEFAKSIGLGRIMTKQIAKKFAERSARNPVKGAIAKGAIEGAKDTVKYDAIANSEVANAGEVALGSAAGGAIAGAFRLIGKEIPKTAVSEQTKRALETATPSELQLYVDSTKKAMGDISQPTAYEIAAKKTEDALDIIDEMKNKVGSEIGNIRAANGEKIVVDPGDLIGKWNEILLKKAKVSFDLGSNGAISLKQTGKVATLPKDEKAILEEFVSQLNAIQKSGKLEIQDLIDINTFLNNNYNKVEKTSQTFKSVIGEIKKESNSLLYSLLPDNYKDIMKQYSELLDIDSHAQRLYGETGERGSTFIRSMFGSNAMRTRETMQKIKDLTGVDLFKEGQLAKFVMEALGDKRGLDAMLEAVSGGPVGITKAVLRKVGDAVANPIKGAKTIIEEGASKGKTPLPKGVQRAIKGTSVGSAEAID